MIRKQFLLLLVCAILAALTSSCKKYYASADTEDGSSGNDSSGSESTDDYIWNSSDVINITLDGNSATCDNDCISVSGSVVTITCAGTYNISGTLSNGQLLVKTNDAGVVRLIFNGVNITCSDNAPIFIKKSPKTVIVLKDGTSNYLTDGSSYNLNSDGEPTAALYSKSYISFCGNGSLTVKASYLDGITGKDGMVIKSGTFNVTANDDGIRGKDFLIIKSGNITVKSKDDGIKSDNEDTSLGYISIDSATVNVTSGGDGIKAKHDITINDGSFTITAGGGASTVSTSTNTTTNPGGGMPGGGTSSGGYNGTNSEKGIKALGNLTIRKGTFIINSADDALHSHGTVTINGGDFSIASGDDAIHAEIAINFSAATLNVSTCYEGLESLTVTINSGAINETATDDDINGTAGTTAGGTESDDGSWVYIKGGTIILTTSTGDGLDSNGSAEISGGTIVVNGPSSAPNVAFDINGTFKVTGGFVVGAGPNAGNMIESPGTSSTQNCVLVTLNSGLSTGNLFNIQNQSGTSLVTFKPVKSVYYVLFSSGDLITGSTYNVYTGGTSTGTYANGIYPDGNYSGGTRKGSFTISKTVTTVSL